MSKSHAIILTLPLFLLAPSLARADDPPPNQCMMVRTISSWKDVDERTAILIAAPRTQYKVTFWAPCRDMKSAAFARLDRGGGRSICLRRGDVIVFRDALPIRGQDWVEERCVIDSIERVSPEPASTP